MQLCHQKKPDWLRVQRPSGKQFRSVRKALSNKSLHTVCEAAGCPNKAECWNAGTATFMILGDRCTRGCAFCAVTRGNPAGAVDRTEAQRVADAAGEMGLEYMVITSVSRDDLPDGGASLFTETIRCLKRLDPAPKVEVLIPDYRDRALDSLLRANPDVLAHNIETVERLSPTYRHQNFSFRRSLQVLEMAGRKDQGVVTKSSIMLGLGETDQEVEQAMRELVAVGVRILALGQYLSPTRQHPPVQEYISPETFDSWAERGRELGFDFVAAGPLVRTSYRAAEAFVQRKLIKTNEIRI